MTEGGACEGAGRRARRVWMVGGRGAGRGWRECGGAVRAAVWRGGEGGVSVAGRLCMTVRTDSVGSSFN